VGASSFTGEFLSPIDSKFFSGGSSISDAIQRGLILIPSPLEMMTHRYEMKSKQVQHHEVETWDEVALNLIHDEPEFQRDPSWR